MKKMGLPNAPVQRPPAPQRAGAQPWAYPEKRVGGPSHHSKRSGKQVEGGGPKKGGGVGGGAPAVGALFTKLLALGGCVGAACGTLW